MRLSSIDYKTLRNRFGEDVQEINDSLYQATKPKATRGQQDAAMETARTKLKEYTGLLERLEGVQRQQVEKDYGELMAEMRGYVSTLEKKVGHV